MLVVEEMWLDLESINAGSKLRMSVRPENMPNLKQLDGAPMTVRLSGPEGEIGAFDLRYVAVIRGLAILEVVGLRLANALSPHPSPSELAISSLPQASS